MSQNVFKTVSTSVVSQWITIKDENQIETIDVFRETLIKEENRNHNGFFCIYDATI